MDPKTIVYVGNFTRPWCTEVHVAKSLRSLGHRVVEAQENRTPWLAVNGLVAKHAADMVLWTRTWPAEMADVLPVLDSLRECGVPTVSYHLDRWFGLDREHQVDDQPFFRTQLVVSPDDSPSWADHGVNHLWMPPAVFDQECGPVPADRRRFPHDVVFIGSYPYPHPEWVDYRRGLIETFEARFGDRFAVLAPAAMGRQLRGRDLQTLYASVPVILGDSCLAGESHRYWSDRIPETLGRGGFLIHPEIDGWVGPDGAAYDGNHLATYPLGDFAEAAAVAESALDERGDPYRAAIANNGRDRVLSRDTYRHRMEALLQHVEETVGWPDRTPRPKVASMPMSPQFGATFQHHRGNARAIFEDDPATVGRPGSTRDVVAEVWKADDYRLRPLDLRGKTVLDVGANVGAFTVLAAKMGAARVVAFEPEANNRGRLIRHLTLNNVGGRVAVVAAAVCCDPGRIAMTGTGGGARLLVENEPRVDLVVVDAVGLRQVIDEHAPIGFLKVDIEGGEYDAFAGVDAHLLHENVERIALEWHGPGIPHLAGMDPEWQAERWRSLVAMLADCGTVEIKGHPTVGGLIHWKPY